MREVPLFQHLSQKRSNVDWCQRGHNVTPSNTLFNHTAGYKGFLVPKSAENPTSYSFKPLFSEGGAEGVFGGSTLLHLAHCHQTTHVNCWDRSNIREHPCRLNSGSLVGRANHHSETGVDRSLQMAGGDITSWLDVQGYLAHKKQPPPPPEPPMTQGTVLL